MKAFALTYGFSLVVLLALDAVWLTTMGNTLYRPAMGGLMRQAPDFVPAAIFYVLYVLGLTLLVTQPVLFGGGSFSLVELAWKAGLFGLVAYATYNLTGLSVISGWPLVVSLIDMAWGTLVTLISAVATALLLKATGMIS